MTFEALTRVRLTPSAQSRFPDIGTGGGVVLRIDGWVVVQWRGSDRESRVPEGDLEVAE